MLDEYRLCGASAAPDPRPGRPSFCMSKPLLYEHDGWLRRARVSRAASTGLREDYMKYRRDAERAAANVERAAAKDTGSSSATTAPPKTTLGQNVASPC
jgi:hypothetical protein